MDRSPAPHLSPDHGLVFEGRPAMVLSYKFWKRLKQKTTTTASAAGSSMATTSKQGTDPQREREKRPKITEVVTPGNFQTVSRWRDCEGALRGCYLMGNRYLLKNGGNDV
ncbi:hypothetical protein BC936DRAFT_145065 [Jimgerdemannia flammicorona]|uniref:Uncharacterized protein n=1 Tax=Jimgerdemannia flammicorona TaxID=994334 RepID=A0A433DB14_9FUNG|nr:hypothetical protein BC936DRAFT_145065 [Jimgerdemannia flammicorona]